MIERSIFSVNDFTGVALEKFCRFLMHISEDATCTDIEIPEDDFARWGILKELKVPSQKEFRLKFSGAELNEILSFISPEKYKTVDGMLGVIPVCFSFSIKNVGHYRVTVLATRTGRLLTLRKLSWVVPSWRDIMFPERLKDIVLNCAGLSETAELCGGNLVSFKASGGSRGGLLLITGPMGSGKTTSLASMVKLLNETFFTKIIMIEDPIEYVHLSSKSIISQIEIGTHIESQEEALFYALRSNSSVIVLGEVRSREELAYLLKASEVGCFVMATYHVPDSVSALERIAYELESDISLKVLASSLVGVINQRLFYIETDTTPRFVLACEWLPVRDLKPVRDFLVSRRFVDIRNGLTKRLWVAQGVVSMDQALKELALKNLFPEALYRKFQKTIVNSDTLFG